MSDDPLARLLLPVDLAVVDEVRAALAEALGEHRLPVLPGVRGAEQRGAQRLVAVDGADDEVVPRLAVQVDDDGVEAERLGHQLVADDRVPAHLPPLVVVEPPGLRDDRRVDRDLADVVELGGATDEGAVERVDPETRRDAGGELGDVERVLGGLRLLGPQDREDELAVALGDRGGAVALVGQRSSARTSAATASASGSTRTAAPNEQRRGSAPAPGSSDHRAPAPRRHRSSGEPSRTSANASAPRAKARPSSSARDPSPACSAAAPEGAVHGTGSVTADIAPGRSAGIARALPARGPGGRP